ncbi:hypothetical protein IJ818_00020 [bacterium]|nr:hypothetical protein [bacterium]
MRLLNRLQMLEGQYMFIKWVGGCEYAKLVNVALDFYEFDVIDIETMEYKETVMIRPDLLMEVTLGGADVQRVLAEMCCNMPSASRD